MSADLIFSGTAFSSYSVPSTHTAYGGATVQYAADGTSIFLPSADSFLQLVDNEICAGICSAEVTVNWNNSFSGNEFGFCLIDAARTGASVIITPSIIRLRNEIAGAGGATITQASVATTGTGKVTFKFEVDLSNGAVTIYKNGVQSLTGVYSGSTTGLRIGLQVYHASDNPIHSYDNLKTITTTTAKTIVSINGGAGVRVGSTGNSISTLNMGTLTGLTINGKAMVNLGAGTFDAPPFVDGQVYGLIGAATAVATDSEGSASRNTSLLPPLNWSVQTLAAPLNTTSSVLVGLTPAAQPGEKILTESLNGFIAPNGVYQGDVDGTFQAVRIRLDGTVDIYNVHTVEPVGGDTTPNSFTIPAVTNAALNAPITSAPVTPTGYDTAAPVTVTGGTVSINGGASTSAPGNISPGQAFTVTVQSSATPATAASATVTIGGVSSAFSVTTLAADTTPNAFSFNTPALAAPGATVTSTNTTITGINAPAAVSVTGGLVSINGGAFVSSGTITNGQTLAARVTASGSFSTPVTATVTVGGVSANFTATTIAADTTPDSFSFSPVVNAALNTQQTSNTITISGLNTSAPVSITGGAYSKNGGSYGQSPGSVVNGDTLSVRHNSSALNSTQITTTLTVGTFSANFISTTIQEEITMPESRVRDWTNTTNNLLDTGVNFFAFDDGLDNVKPGVKVPPKAFLKSILPANATSPSYLLNDGVCSIGTHVDGATITAPGIVGFPNKIGSSTSIPLGTDAIHSWAVDSAYVPATAAADYAGIGIGYDNVNNQIAGVCNGFHCYIQYNVDGHSSVLSGSYQWIAGGRGVIAQGTNNKITASSLFGFIGNGRYQTVSGNWGTLVNGTDTIASGQGAFGGYARDALLSGEGSTALAARDVVVAGTFGLVQGQNTYIGGAYSVSFGNLNELGGVNSFAAGLSVRSTGDYSAVIGNDCGSAAAFSLTMGRHTENLQKASFAQSSRKITSQGDCQVYFANTAVRTTGNTPTNLEVASGEHLVIPDQSCWTCSIVLTAANEATGDQASWEILADVKRFNGATTIVGTPTVTARANALTVGAAPTIGVNAAEGLTRVVVTGAAATNIVWNASWRISQIKLPNSDTFTAATTDILTLATAAKRFLNGEKVRVSNSGGALPAGLSAGVDYYVVQGTNYYGNVSFKLATTATGIKLNKTTAVLGGQNVNTMATVSSVVDITDTGTGTHTITRF